MKAGRLAGLVRYAGLVAAITVFSVGTSWGEVEKILWRQDDPNGLKIAFIGDQGASEKDGGDRAPEVLQLIKDEGADVVVHQGDFDYAHDPAAWDGMISKVLGEDFPYFGSAGNHDIHIWEGYQKVLEARARRIPIPWDGRMGVKSSLRYRGVFIVLVAPGTRTTSENSWRKTTRSGGLPAGTRTSVRCRWVESRARRDGMCMRKLAWVVRSSRRATNIPTADRIC